MHPPPPSHSRSHLWDHTRYAIVDVKADHNPGAGGTVSVFGVLTGLGENTLGKCLPAPSVYTKPINARRMSFTYIFNT